MPDRFDVAMSLVDDRDFSAALEAAKEAYAERPGDADGWFLLASFHELLGQFPGSLAALLRADQLSPGQPFVLLAIADVRIRLGDPAGAQNASRQAVAVDPDLAMAHFTLGRTQRLLDDHAGAAESFHSAARALARRWARDLPGEGEGPRRPYSRPSAGLWLEVAAVAAQTVAERAGIGGFVLPAGHAAEGGSGSNPFRVRYWEDVASEVGGMTRRFLPGFLDALVAFLRADGLYVRLLEEWSGALEMLGEVERARRLLEEAESFRRWAGLEPLPPAPGFTA